MYGSSMEGKRIFTWETLANGAQHFREFARLRNLLGEAFPRRAARIQPPSKNPILASLLVPFNGAVAGLETWSQSLTTLSGVAGLDSVLADLQSHRDSTEPSHAFYLIEAAAKLFHAGLKVSFEPSLPSGFASKPDLMLEHDATREKFYLELTVQSLSSKQVEGLRLLAISIPKAAFPDVLCAAVWHDMPSDGQLRSVAGKVDSAIGIARETETLVEIAEKDVLMMAVCHRSKKEMLDKWRTSKGLSGSCYGQGPRDKTDEISRMKHKIQMKHRQLPAGHPNIIFIQSNSIFNHVKLDALRYEIENAMSQRSHVAAVVVCGCNLGSARPIQLLQTSTSRFEQRVREDRIEHTLLIWNDRAAPKPSPSLKDAVLRAFFQTE
jgi:hypothetical protein